MDINPGKNNVYIKCSVNRIQILSAISDVIITCIYLSQGVMYTIPYNRIRKFINEKFNVRRKEETIPLHVSILFKSHSCPHLLKTRGGLLLLLSKHMQNYSS